MEKQKQHNHAVEKRIQAALDFAHWGSTDGAHHKDWVIDQMVRALVAGAEQLRSDREDVVPTDENEEEGWDD